MCAASHMEQKKLCAFEATAWLKIKRFQRPSLRLLARHPRYCRLEIKVGIHIIAAGRVGEETVQRNRQERRFTFCSITTEDTCSFQTGTARLTSAVITLGELYLMAQIAVVVIAGSGSSMPATVGPLLHHIRRAAIQSAQIHIHIVQSIRKRSPKQTTPRGNIRDSLKECTGKGQGFIAFLASTPNASPIAGILQSLVLTAIGFVAILAVLATAPLVEFHGDFVVFAVTIARGRRSTPGTVACLGNGADGATERRILFLRMASNWFGASTRLVRDGKEACFAGATAVGYSSPGLPQTASRMHLLLCLRMLGISFFPSMPLRPSRLEVSWSIDKMRRPPRPSLLANSILASNVSSSS